MKLTLPTSFVDEMIKVTKTLTGTPRENDKGPLSLKFTTEQVVYASLEVIENQAPVSSSISDQSCEQGLPFKFVVPRSTFSDTPWGHRCIVKDGFRGKQL